MKLLTLAAAVAVLATAGTAAVAQDTQTAPAPAAPAAAPAPATEDPPGGYQPSTPVLQGDTSSGQKPIFQPNPQTPAQAFPPPPPLDKYPVCKKGQFDNCRQRGG